MGRSVVIRIVAASLLGVAVSSAFIRLNSVNAEDASQSFQIPDGKRVAFCGLFKSGWQPALKKSETRFVSVRSELRLLDKQIKKARDSRTRDKLIKPKTNYTALFSRTRKTCAAGPGETPPTQPTPTPTPTSPPGLGCFRPGGDVTPGCFGIPPHLTGNINRGQSYFQRNCTGCHANRGIRSWSQVLGTFSRIPQMQPYRPADPDLADVVAYLNRFNF
jgi:hypothetical protein